MLKTLRLRHVLSPGLGLGGALAAALAGVGALASGCGPQPVGVESCRQIETARCEAAAACGLSEDDVANCKLVYQDQCLHGIQNADHRPTEAETEACVAAVKAAGACAADGAKKIGECKDAPSVTGSENIPPCDLVLSDAHELSACSFVRAAEGDTTSSSSSSSSSGSGGSTGTGGSGGSN